MDLDSRTTVSTLDPDAPLRTGSALAEQDQEDETRLMRKVLLARTPLYHLRMYTTIESMACHVFR